MKRVLVIGPRYYNFLQSVEDAFRQLGREVSLLGYDNPIDPYTGMTKVRYRLGRQPSRDRMQEKSREAFREKAEKTFLSFAPELVFVVNGDILSPGTLDLFGRNAKVVLWLFDNISKMPACLPLLGHCHRVFSFDLSDVEQIRSMGVQADFLPQAVDPRLYHPLNLVRDIDILFVGNLFYYPNRQRILKKVIEAFPDRRILIAGEYKPWYKNPVKCLLRERRDVYTNRNVTPEEVNILYNRAKVALNIHREDQRDGANPRVFEICASGTYQICDSNPYVESVFGGGETGIYHNEDELIRLIDAALSRPEPEKAAAAMSLTLESHTFLNRIRKVVED